MSRKSSLDIARNLIKRRKFDLALRILEPCEEKYDDSFDYCLLMGISNLYLDIPGNASKWFGKARTVKINDATLLLGQAVIFLRNNNIPRALQYYLDVLDLDPDNTIALSALDFIHKGVDETKIDKMIETGEIKRFYPSLGFNPDIVRNCVLLGLLFGLIGSLLVVFNPFAGMKKTLSDFDAKFSLSKEETKNPLQSSSSFDSFDISLKANQVSRAFSAAKRLFADGRDNASHVELNRIIYSNAAESIKNKSYEMISMLKEPTFNTLKDNYSFEEVKDFPLLYQDCYVIWDGSITNIEEQADGKWSCELLVGYIPSEKKLSVEGLAKVIFDYEPSPAIDEEKPVRILGQVYSENGDILLLGRGIHQELKKQQKN